MTTPDSTGRHYQHIQSRVRIEQLLVQSYRCEQLQRLSLRFISLV